MRRLLFGKKRGSRRTGSRLAGRLWELGLYLVLFAIGCAGVMVVLGSLATRSWPATEYFRSFYMAEARGEFVDERPFEGKQDGTLKGRELRIRFQVGDKRYVRWLLDDQTDNEVSLARGDEVWLWVDPLDPDSATIRQPSWWGLWLTLAVTVALAVLGASAVVRTALQLGVSEERRSALAQKATDSSVLSLGERTESNWPTVPTVDNLTDSPGVKLAYRLPIDGPPSWRLAASASLALACGGLATSFLVFVIQALTQGNLPWLLMMFSLPLMLLAVWAIYHFLGEVIDAASSGSVAVEISDLPLLPGRTYGICLMNSSRQPTSTVTLTAVCDEATTFRQGTDVRHDVERVFEQVLFRDTVSGNDSSESHEADCTLSLPPHVMHSFQGIHNAVRWCLLVELATETGERWQKTYPLVVRPRP